jgi:hypothetical protein
MTIWLTKAFDPAEPRKPMIHQLDPDASEECHRTFVADEAVRRRPGLVVVHLRRSR